MRHKILAGFIMMIVILTATVVIASVTFTPPDSSTPVDMATIKLDPQKAAPKASGTASLICNKENTTHVFTIEVKGLNPGKVYTAWFAKMSDSEIVMAGIGKTPYILKVDRSGYARMTYSPTKCPAKQGWQMIEIAEHADKNARNTDVKNLIPVLIGKMINL